MQKMFVLWTIYGDFMDICTKHFSVVCLFMTSYHHENANTQIISFHFSKAIYSEKGRQKNEWYILIETIRENFHCGCVCLMCAGD